MVVPFETSLTFVSRLEMFSNPHIRPLWRQAWAANEDALRTRISRTTESLKSHSRPLRPLLLGERVFLQNKRDPNPNKWDRSGVVVELLTGRNRRLRAIDFAQSPIPPRVYSSHLVRPTTFQHSSTTALLPGTHSLCSSSSHEYSTTSGTKRHRFTPPPTPRDRRHSTDAPW